MAALTLPEPPPHQASPGKRSEFKVLQLELGDGYEQAVADGINTNREFWDLVWENEDQDDIDTLTAFFDARGGFEPFFWTPPGEVTPKLWRANEGYTLKPGAGFSSTLAITFKRWFGEEPA